VKRLAVVALIVIGIALIHDVVVEPSRAFGARAAVSAIDGYRRNISPRMSKIVTCRFQPTCSVYTRAKILKDGLLIGGAKSTLRIAKCGPWTKQGTIDMP
jgi:putative membrane protein insertion efficiency factor